MSFRQNSDAPVLSDALSASPAVSRNQPHDAAAPNARAEKSPRRFGNLASRSGRGVPKAVYAVVPSVLLLGLALATRKSELSAPTSSTRSAGALQTEGRNAILAASQTMIVPATAAAPPTPLMLPAAGSVVWRARLEPVVDVVGRAPIAGQITRVWARTGQSVAVGDRVLRILSYSSNTVVPPPRRTYDNAAEDEQVRAVRAQSELGTRLSQAQARLKAAQGRVTRAQSRIDEAMSIVRKLQSGDAGANDAIEYSNEDAAPKSSGPSASEVQAAQAASERASQAAENARSEAVDAERSASRAEAEAQDKARRARELQQTRDAAKTAVPKAAPADDATTNSVAPPPKVEAPAVSAGAVSAAEAAAREAANRAASLRSRANAAKTAADKAEARSQSATSRAKAALRSLQLFDDAPAKRTPAPRSSTRSNTRAANLPSIEEASRMVREATSESRAASREAERWKSEVDAYTRQARQTQQRLANSEQNLGSSQQQEQQQELETTLQRNLSVVRAPANGTIVQIGDVGDNVSFGDPILMVGKTGVLRAQFSDTSGLWRKLKRGATLPATVSMSESKTSRKPATSSTRSSVDAPSNASANAIPVMARVDEVEEPAQKGAPALVKTTVRTLVSAAMKPTAADNAANTDATNAETTNAEATDSSSPEKRVRLRAGMTIVCAVDGVSIAKNEVSRAAQKANDGAVVVPQEAVVMVGEADALDEVSTNARAFVAVLLPDQSGDFAIEWREVQAQNAPLPAQRLVRGLVAGERVVLDAASLRDWTLNYGDEARVVLRDAAPEELK